MRKNSTRVRDQPSLTTSSGRSWLVLGGILAGTGVAILVAMLSLGLPSVAVVGIVAIVVLYAVMIAARLAIPPGRLRLWVMAGAMLGIAAFALVCIAVIAAYEGSLLA